MTKLYELHPNQLIGTTVQHYYLKDVTGYVDSVQSSSGQLDLIIKWNTGVSEMCFHTDATVEVIAIQDRTVELSQKANAVLRKFIKKDQLRTQV